MTDPHLERIREQFTRQAEAYARMKQTSDEKALDRIAALTGVGAADRALDVACGPGYLTMSFAKQCREAIGIDATEALFAWASQEAQRRGLSNLRIVRLCDPTHVAALTEPQFDRLFEDAGLDVEMKPTATIDYDVDEWMGHGGPSPAAQRDIRTLLEASIDDDCSGLCVRRETAGLRFSHHAAAFVSRVPLA